jgi:hypothetical protein
VTVESATAGHNWPDDEEIGDGGLDHLRLVWPFLSQDLRRAIIAIAKIADEPKIDLDRLDQYPKSVTDLIPF